MSERLELPPDVYQLRAEVRQLAMPYYEALIRDQPDRTALGEQYYAKFDDMLRAALNIAECDALAARVKVLTDLLKGWHMTHGWKDLRARDESFDDCQFVLCVEARAALAKPQEATR